MSEAATQPRPGRLRRLDCPNCGGSVEIKANGISVTAICGSCGAALDVASEDVRIIAEAQQRTREPQLPLGRRGVLAGTEWEVTGYQQRSNPKEGWEWEEYLLFNPYRGFRFLACDDEGWTLFCMLRQDVPLTAKVEGDRHSYGPPTTSQARTDYVLGEFYWRVRVGDIAEVQEHKAAGGWSLVRETSGSEIVWSRGLRLTSEQMRKAFGVGPTAEELARTEPRLHTRAVVRIGLLALFVLLLLSSCDLDRYGEREIFRENETATTSNRGAPIATQPFTVPDPGGNLRIQVSAPLQNNWAEVGISLAPDGGGPSYDATLEIEYYNGTDSDGAWTEGGQTESVVFRNVPGGTYRLLLDVDSGVLTGRSLAPSLPLSIEVRRHVPAPEFFWFALLLLVSYPIYRWLFRRGKK